MKWSLRNRTTSVQPSTPGLMHLLSSSMRSTISLSLFSSSQSSTAFFVVLKRSVGDSVVSSCRDIPEVASSLAMAYAIRASSDSSRDDASPSAYEVISLKLTKMTTLLSLRSFSPISINERVFPTRLHPTRVPGGTRVVPSVCSMRGAIILKADSSHGAPVSSEPTNSGSSSGTGCPAIACGFLFFSSVGERKSFRSSSRAGGP
mmetsp:Transcript_31730/g.101677  ORF Transcript_31730/g.101677 Transcript_31730/m.101677 type:complete len:204 (+) Transcript_31730:1329-1940(+)